MTKANVFELAQIIKSSGADPSDVTDAVWAAGYRKPAREAEEAVNLALDIICGFEGADLPWDVWPKSYADILKGELNDFVVEAITPDEATAASAAKELIAEGYSKVTAGEPDNCRSNEKAQVRLVPRELTDDMGEAIAFTAGCCGGIASDIWEAVLAAAPAIGDIRLDSITLPPIMDLDGRTGRSLIIANTHNAAVTLCAMAIREAGFETECSPLLGSEVSTNG